MQYMKWSGKHKFVIILGYKTSAIPNTFSEQGIIRNQVR